MADSPVSRAAFDAFGVRLSKQLTELVQLAVFEFERDAFDPSMRKAECVKPILPVHLGLVKLQVPKEDLLPEEDHKQNHPMTLQVRTMIAGAGQFAETNPETGLESRETALGSGSARSSDVFCDEPRSPTFKRHVEEHAYEVEENGECEPDFISKSSLSTNNIVNLNKRDSDVDEEDNTATEAIFVGRLFKECDRNKAGTVPAQMVFEVLHLRSLGAHAITDRRRRGTAITKENAQEFTEAIAHLNEFLGDRHEGPNDHVCIETLKAMMLCESGTLADEIGSDHAKLFVNLREACAKEDLSSKVADVCNVERAGLAAYSRTSSLGRIPWLKPILELYLEPAVTVVIICNALTIGISLDHGVDWPGWKIIEGFYTFFFVSELVLRTSVFGCADHFLGPDWSWNWFDLLIVVFALMEVFVVIMSSLTSFEGASFSGLTMIRLIRLVRVARLVRLLRLKIFQELAIMINGIIGGIRTLFWAMVFLLVVVYSLGVLVRQLLDPELSGYECAAAVEQGLMDQHGNFPSDANCNRGAYTLDIYGHILFASVARCMLTVFSCFTTGCETPAGQPLMWHIWDTHGWVFVVFYVVAYIFVTFGIFNLILAIFVENTLAYARSSEQKRCASRNRANLARAKQLQRLLTKICTITDYDGQNAAAAEGQDKLGLRKYLSMSRGGTIESNTIEDSHMSLRVDRETFESAMNLEEVQSLLEDLEVSFSSRQKLFEVIDADGNGYLTVSELAEGIMRLRGPADKGDVVSNSLMLRSMQQNARRLERTTLEKMARLEQVSLQLEAASATNQCKVMDKLNGLVAVIGNVTTTMNEDGRVQTRV